MLTLNMNSVHEVIMPGVDVQNYYAQLFSYAMKWLNCIVIMLGVGLNVQSYYANTELNCQLCYKVT